MSSEIEKVNDESFAEFMIELVKGIDPTNSLSIIEKGAKYFAAKQNKKIYEFNKKLFHGEASSYEKKIFKDKILSEDDYFSLLTASINDDEEKKTTIYVTLYRNILQDKVEDNTFKILKILKSLTYSSLELIKKIYIFSNFEIQDNGNTKTISSFLKEIQKDENYIFEIEELKQCGAIRTTVDFDESTFDVTKFCLILAKLFFNENELTPKSINEKYWISKVSILSDLNNPENIQSISNLIQTIGIKTLSNIGFNANLKNLYADTLICIIDNKISPKTIQELKEMSKYKNIMKVSLNKTNKDWLVDINNEVTYLDLNCKGSKENFLNMLEINPIKLF